MVQWAMTVPATCQLRDAAAAEWRAGYSWQLVRGVEAESELPCARGWDHARKRDCFKKDAWVAWLHAMGQHGELTMVVLPAYKYIAGSRWVRAL